MNPELNIRLTTAEVSSQSTTRTNTPNSSVRTIFENTVWHLPLNIPSSKLSVLPSDNDQIDGKLSDDYVTISAFKDVSVAVDTSCGHDICRMCQVDEPNQLLLNVCDCSGSLSHVHSTCLEQWIKLRPDGLKFDSLQNAEVERVTCELCKVPYRVRIARSLSFNWQLLSKRDLITVMIELLILLGLLIAFNVAVQVVLAIRVTISVLCCVFVVTIVMRYAYQVAHAMIVYRIAEARLATAQSHEKLSLDVALKSSDDVELSVHNMRLCVDDDKIGSIKTIDIEDKV